MRLPWNPWPAASVALIGFACGALWQGAPQPAYAQGRSAAGEVVAVPAPGRGVGHNVLFVFDSATQHLLVYEHTAGGALELVASRDAQYDLRLSDFPSQDKGPPARRQKPSVAEVKAAVK